jgi:hypothetical protein
VALAFLAIDLHGIASGLAAKEALTLLRESGARTTASAPSGTTDGAPLRSAVLVGCVRGTCCTPAGCNPPYDFKPSVSMVEPGAT